MNRRPEATGKFTDSPRHEKMFFPQKKERRYSTTLQILTLPTVCCRCSSVCRSRVSLAPCARISLIRLCCNGSWRPPFRLCLVCSTHFPPFPKFPLFYHILKFLARTAKIPRRFFGFARIAVLRFFAKTPKRQALHGFPQKIPTENFGKLSKIFRHNENFSVPGKIFQTPSFLLPVLPLYYSQWRESSLFYWEVVV